MSRFWITYVMRFLFPHFLVIDYVVWVWSVDQHLRVSLVLSARAYM
jgi:hypothetical protein